MAVRDEKDNLPAKTTKRDKSGPKATKSSRKAARPAKSNTKDNLMNYTKQLTSLGNLQQVIIINLQKEIEKI